MQSKHYEIGKKERNPLARTLLMPGELGPEAVRRETTDGGSRRGRRDEGCVMGGRRKDGSGPVSRGWAWGKKEEGSLPCSGGPECWVPREAP